MKIGILGFGVVAQALGAGLRKKGPRRHARHLERGQAR